MATAQRAEDTVGFVEANWVGKGWFARVGLQGFAWVVQLDEKNKETIKARIGPGF